jgi:hypothetical protein
MINKHENIGVGVYWDDVGVPGWMLSGWSKLRETNSSKICKNTVAVHSVWRDIYVATEIGGQMRGCCVLLRAPAHPCNGYRKIALGNFKLCRSQWPWGLRRGSWPVGCWDRGFESRSRHGCLSASFCVVLSCVGKGLATGWSLVQGILTYV